MKIFEKCCEKLLKILCGQDNKKYTDVKVWTTDVNALATKSKMLPVKELRLLPTKLKRMKTSIRRNETKSRKKWLQLVHLEFWERRIILCAYKTLHSIGCCV